MKTHSRHIVIAAATLAVTSSLASAGTSTNTAGSTRAGAGLPALTVSYSGQVALKPFSNGPAFTFLTPGTSITLNVGPGNSPVTFTANNTPGTRVQLASSDFTLPDVGTDYSSGVPDVQRHSAIRVEWHEQGSAEGLIDVINDQVGYAGGFAGTPLSNVGTRGPSVANPTWVNTTAFTNTAAPQTLNGHTLDNRNFGNTYDSTVYDRPTGRNLLGGQDRVQFSQGEFKIESFNRPGVANARRSAGQAGYGQGNPALANGPTANGLGSSGTRQTFRPSSVVNLSTDKIDPQSTTNATYAPGPWNTAGANNIDSRQFAVTAVTFSANPGTGLSRVNESDARWIQALGRLANGAEFNNVTRSADTGQRIVFALASGLDPSWVTGENDDGNTTTNAAAQRQVGPGIRFSGKTSGSEARNAVAQSRLGVGALSLVENRGASSAAPLRALDVAWGYDVDPTNSAEFIRVNFDSIRDFKTKSVLISHYNTIKRPRPDLLAAYQAANPSATPEQIQAWWDNLSSDETQGGTGIKGDVYGAARAVINNVTNSIGTAAAGLQPNTVANPADGLFTSGFLIPQLLNFKREFTGGPLTPNPLDAQQLALQNDVKTNYGAFFTPDGASGSNSQTIGSNAKYGQLGTAAPFLGDIFITAKDAAGNAVGNGTLAPKGNYLFGNFDQDGTRDFASVKTAVGAALALRAAERTASPGSVTGTPDNSAFRGVVNSTVVAPLSGTPAWSATANTKGDLIVLGDFNTDGAFDGQDVYLLARGASLSDNASTDQLTGTFADSVRNPNARLNKNAALDFAQAATANTADADQQFLRTTARATLRGASLPSGATQISSTGGVITYTFDPAGANAFNKLDVNRDGRVDRDDAKVVDAFVGKSYRNLDDQLFAVVRTDLTPGGTAFANGVAPLDPTDPANAAIPRRQISLVDVELTDDAVITSIGAIANNDVRTIVSSLLTSGKLLAGDFDFTGTVNFDDLLLLASNYNKIDASLPSGSPGFIGKWSTGDANFDGIVNFDDLLALAANYNQSALGGGWALAQTSVPEPTSLAVVGVGAASLLSRRRRRTR
jgi:hypothetical protein